MFGLILLLAGARRTSRRGQAARRGLKQSRRETAAASQARDDLIDERDTARAPAAGTPGNGTAASGRPRAGDTRRHMPHLFRHRPAAAPGGATDPDPAAGPPIGATAPPQSAGSSANGSLTITKRAGHPREAFKGGVKQVTGMLTRDRHTSAASHRDGAKRNAIRAWATIKAPSVR